MGGQQGPYDNFQQKGFQNIHGNYNQAGDNKPQQRQNLWDHIAKLEESLTKLTEVIITNHKNREAIIKSMETQIGQLAKQFQTSLSGFSATIKENPKGHCKAIISTLECDVGGEEEEVEESTMLEEEMKAQANPSTQGMQSSLNPPLFDFSKLSIHKQGDNERMAKFEKYMEML
ncbi:hypothetical protein HKD37_05G012830 [Glycine soja]